MADEKSKNLTDTEQKTPPVLDKAKVARGTPAPEQEPPAPDKAPAQKAPDKKEKAADWC